MQRVFLPYLPSPTATGSRPSLVSMLDHKEECITKQRVSLKEDTEWKCVLIFLVAS